MRMIHHVTDSAEFPRKVGYLDDIYQHVYHNLRYEQNVERNTGSEYTFLLIFSPSSGEQYEHDAF